jgi:hypothetical protein
MGKSAVIFSSEIISAHDLNDIVSLMNGAEVPDSSGRFWIGCSDADIWVSLVGDKEMSFYEGIGTERWGGFLQKVKTVVEIQIGRGDGSRLLSLLFCVRLSSKFKIVIEDEDEKIFFGDEIRSAYENERGAKTETPTFF